MYSRLTQSYYVSSKFGDQVECMLPHTPLQMGTMHVLIKRHRCVCQCCLFADFLTFTLQTKQTCQIWSMEVRISALCAAKKEALPPTTEVFVYNVKHAHLQACVGKHALDPEHPNIELVWLVNRQIIPVKR